MTDTAATSTPSTQAVPTEAPGAETGPAPLAIDLAADWHVHTDLGAGSASAVGMVDAAQAAGLHTVGISDRVTAATEWLPDYVAMVRSFARPEISVYCGVETAVIDLAGRLDLPAELPTLDYVVLVVDGLPTPDGPVRPEAVRAALSAGDTTPAEVVDQVVAATVAAVQASPVRPLVGRPFSLLATLGLDDDAVTDAHLAALVEACRAGGGSVEVATRAALPTARVARAFAEAGIALVAGSDARAVEEVGAWDRLDALVGERPATPAAALEEIVAADGLDVAVAVNEELADEVEAVTDATAEDTDA